MTAIAISRPQSDEFAPYYGKYINDVAPIEDAVGVLTVQSNRLVRQLAALSDAQANFRYAEGKWSVKEVLGHVSDAERIFAYRLLRIARGDGTPMPGFDENEYVPAGKFDARAMADVLEEWIAVRTATTALVRGIPSEAWTRRGVANGQPVSARAILYIMLGHIDHHATMLEERYGIAR
ncbi:MAG: DinB family protein [Acidimicrobiia bacterium]|nr:DinB family protein [Acidimicrobiia bacterium]